MKEKLKAMYKLLKKKVGDGEQQPKFRVPNQIRTLWKIDSHAGIRDKVKEMTNWSFTFFLRNLGTE